MNTTELSAAELRKCTPEDFWLYYKKRAYGEQRMCPDHEKECMTAFLAGALAALGLLSQVVEKLPESEGVRVLDSFEERCLVVARANNPNGGN